MMYVYVLLQERLLRLLPLQLALSIQYNRLVQHRLRSYIPLHNLNLGPISTCLCARTEADVERLALVIDVYDELPVVFVGEAGR
jgi:hypothetical protein